MRSLVSVSALALLGLSAASGAQAQTYGQPYGVAYPQPYGAAYPQNTCGNCVYPPQYAPAPVQWAPAQSACGGCSYQAPYPAPMQYVPAPVQYAAPPVQWVAPQPEAPLPPPTPQQCFAKSLIPEVTESIPEQVMVEPGRVDRIVTRGETRTEQKQVLTREETVELVNIPPTYRTVTETVVVKPATTRLEVIPAVYDTVTEQIKVREGYEEWRPGQLVAGYSASAGAYGAAKPVNGYMEHNPAYGGVPTRELPTGGVLCLIKVPPEYKTVTKQVLRTPSRTVEIHVPEETQTISRQVVDQPARVEKRTVPAVYSSVPVNFTGPDNVRSVTIAPTYKTIYKTRTVKPERFEWTEVSCVGQDGAAAVHYQAAEPLMVQPMSSGYGAPAPQPMPPMVGARY